MPLTINKLIIISMAVGIAGVLSHWHDAKSKLAAARMKSEQALDSQQPTLEPNDSPTSDVAVEAQVPRNPAGQDFTHPEVVVSLVLTDDENAYVNQLKEQLLKTPYIERTLSDISASLSPAQRIRLFPKILVAAHGLYEADPALNKRDFRLRVYDEIKFILTEGAQHQQSQSDAAANVIDLMALYARFGDSPSESIRETAEILAAAPTPVFEAQLRFAIRRTMPDLAASIEERAKQLTNSAVKVVTAH